MPEEILVLQGARTALAAWNGRLAHLTKIQLGTGAARLGVASACLGGSQGIALMVEGAR